MIKFEKMTATSKKSGKEYTCLLILIDGVIVQRIFPSELEWAYWDSMIDRVYVLKNSVERI